MAAFLLRDGPPSPYDCKKCYFDVRELGRPVLETSEGYWHDSCFTCKVCRENVRAEYYFADDMLLCPEHYEMRRGGFCKICYGQLDAECVSCNHGKYHARCAVCPVCKTHVQPGSDVIIDKNRLAFFHRECLKCQVCGQTDGNLVHEAEKGERMIRCERCEAEGSLPPVTANSRRTSSRVILETNFESSTQPEKEQQQLNTSRFGDVHPLVSQAVEYLSKPRHLSEEGLFRVPGHASEVFAFKQRFDNGDDVDLSTASDCHTVAGLLKQFLRSPPLFDRASALAINSAVEETDGDLREKLESLTHFDTLGALMWLFDKVVRNEHNRMAHRSLATSLGVSLFPALSLKATTKVLETLTASGASIWPELWQQQTPSATASHTQNQQFSNGDPASTLTSF